MGTFKRYLLAAAIGCFVGAASANDFNLNFGAGVKGTHGKMLGASVELVSVWHTYVTGGAILLFDNNLFNSVPLFGGEALVHVGVVSQTGLFVDVAFGAAVLSGTSKRLSGQLQLPTMGTVGLTNGDYAVGFFYKHYSDGGLTSPNLGLDFVGLDIKFDL